MNSSLVNVAETFGLSPDQTMTGTSPLVRRQHTPARRRAIAEAAEMWKRVFDGDIRAAVLVQEALSTSDLFVSATGDVLDRELLAQYSDITPEWQSFATRTTVRNFKPKKMVDILGGRTALELVPELDEYPTSDYDTAEYEIAVKKFGRRFGFSWEALINDDLDELRQIPNRFASAAAITEDNAALEQLVTVSTGAPNAAFFKAGNGNAVDTKVLNVDNLSAAVTTVSTKTDGEGNIVAPNGLILVVGPAQEMNARRLLGASEIRTTVNGQEVVETNWLRGLVTLVVLKRLKGTAWFVLPAPASATRPSFAVAFLRGYETPDIRVKSDAGQRPGGGEVPAEEGSFDNDSVQYRVRHVVGGASVDPMHTYAATGTSS